MLKTFFVSLIILFSISSKLYAEIPKTGIWHFEFKSPNASIPFLMDLNFTPKAVKGAILNGEEKIPVLGSFTNKSRIVIPISTYEINLELNIISPTVIRGSWIRYNKDPKIIVPVEGIYGLRDRFSIELKKTALDLSGKWEIDLTDEQGVKSTGIILFKQKQNYLSGSILTPTGDYRYMEGYISGEDFEAASFDGMFNYVLKGSVKGDKISASLLSLYKISIQGKRNDSITLPDAYKATQLESPLKFTFPNLQGTPVSLNDKKFQNKPLIIQFFGSWCPNCLDEMNYLIPWYQENKKRGIEIIALAFERSLSEKLAKIQLKKIQATNHVSYELLLAGSTSEDRPMEKIKGLKNFISFPTTLFLNRKHEVFKIHAGFSGPGTGPFYEQWKKEFNENVNEILRQ
jgi:thiol-disulfide isomerase/thioredoxin